mmetsp:Transcript_4832/g.10226  ORF Transcript_4832/g.10226 Transcript_4832/m.10226 type:complete len:210 (-) Transcript_4832:614-1243(-)
MRLRGKGQGWDSTNATVVGSTATPLSSAVSRTQHPSSVSPTSANPLRVEYRPAGQNDLRPRRAYSPQGDVTSMIAAASMRGYTDPRQAAPPSRSVHRRAPPARATTVGAPHVPQNRWARWNSTRPLAAAHTAASDGCDSASPNSRRGVREMVWMSSNRASASVRRRRRRTRSSTVRRSPFDCPPDAIHVLSPFSPSSSAAASSGTWTAQ